MSIELDNLTDNQYNFFINHIYNGMGSEQLRVKAPPYIFSKAAIKHDFYFFGGGTIADRKLADRQFLSDCFNIIKVSKKYKYYPIACFYYIILLIFSRYAWDIYESRPNTWKQFLNRVYKSTVRNDTKPKKLSKRILKLHIKNPDIFKETLPI